MGRFSRMAVVLCVSVAVALALSKLPQVEQAARMGAEDFGGKRGKLTEQNLVDALVAVPLELNIVRAELRQSVLAVDLGLSQGKVSEYAVYRDLYELSQYGLSNTTNIEQVQVRIMEIGKTDPKSRQLLLAMDARRENRPKAEEKAGESSTLNLKELIQSHYSLTFTQKWKDSIIFAP